MNKLFTLFFFSLSVFAQAKDSGAKFNFFTDLLGRKGLIFVVGALFFFFAYKNSLKLFTWVEDQTYGTRDYILQKCELLHVEINPKHITYLLIYMYIGNSLLLISMMALMGKIGTGVFLGVISSLFGWRFPRPFMNFLVNRRIKVYTTQMVDALNLLANGLRAGLSVPQSIGLVVDELPAPVSQEFNVILQQTKIGVPLEEAFENLVVRVPTQDNEMFVSSVNILRETGGNLAEVFDTITDVIRARVRLGQKIDTYVAQGKFQGYTIAAMPFIIGGIFSSSDPKTAELLFGTIPGNLAIALAVILDAIGLYVILKVVDIKV